MYDRQKRIEEASKDAASSAGLTGLILGGGLGVLGGAKSLKSLMKASLAGGALGAAGAGGGTYVGSQILGPPSNEEPGSYTTTAGLGGALAMGAAGAGLGALYGKGGLRWLGKMPFTEHLAEKAAPLADNLIIEKLRKLEGKPKQAAALLGGTGALGGAYLGSDEGMYQDYLASLMREEREKKIREAMNVGL